RGQALCSYLNVTTVNDYIKLGWVIYDATSRTFEKAEVAFPETFFDENSAALGPIVEVVDMNEDGALLGYGPDGIFLCDDGKCYAIDPPVGWFINPMGMNNNGEVLR